jgi:hypothetical protein
MIAAAGRRGQPHRVRGLLDGTPAGREDDIARHAAKSISIWAFVRWIG